MHGLGGPRYNPQIEHAGADTEYRTKGQRHVGSQRGAAFPEHAHHKHGGHRRGNEAQHRLEHIEEIHALDVIHCHGDDNRHQGADDRDDAPCAGDFSLCGLRTDILHINIHREHGAQGIEGRTDGADQGCSENGQHKTHHAHGKQVRHQRHVGIVGLDGHATEETRLHQGKTDDARHDVNRHIENLQPSREVGATLPLAQVLGGQHGLYHRLVGAPEPQS